MPLRGRRTRCYFITHCKAGLGCFYRKGYFSIRGHPGSGLGQAPGTEKKELGFRLKHAGMTVWGCMRNVLCGFDAFLGENNEIEACIYEKKWEI